MKNMDLKTKVLDEIIGMMDDKEGEMLKKKSPKFMAMSVEIKKPKAEEMKEDMGESKDEEGSELELSPEMIQKLLEKLQE